MRSNVKTSSANSGTVPLENVPYLDFPELKFNDHESTQMPFRYVKGDDGKPVMPEVCCFHVRSIVSMWEAADNPIQGMVDLIRKDADKAIDDLF